MAGRESRTPLFSFDTPSRDRSSTRNIRNSTTRDIVRNIVEPGTPTTTTTTALSCYRIDTAKRYYEYNCLYTKHYSGTISQRGNVFFASYIYE